MVRLPNHWIVMKISSAECEGKPPAQHKIKVMAETMPPSSEYGKNPQLTKDTLRSKGLRICDHRDGDNGDDVTLYYPGFQRFIDQCNDATYECRPEEYIFIEHVCTQMSRYMPKGDKEVEGKKSETIRQIAFMKLINQYLKNNLIPDSDVIDEVAQKIHTNQDIAFEPDDAMRKDGDKSDGYVDPCKCVILEVKNESGQGGGSDSYAQAIAYYVKTLEDKPVGRCPAPAFLLELVGPHLFISGAVYGKYVFVDRLVDPVWLVPHQREEAMIRITRIFKALKRAIGEIQGYYYEEKPPVSQPRFPIFQSFYKGKIRYEEAIKRHTFKGTLIYHDKTSEDVLVMFVKRYSRETHELMDSHGYAPKLIHYEERVGGTQYTAIVMEYILNAMPLDEFLEYTTKYKNFNEIKEYACESCTEALKVMHSNGFCHGKISSKNILGNIQNKKIRIFIVNYEWAGRQGEARYPLSADIPEGAQPGYPITQEQDLAQLEKLLQ